MHKHVGERVKREEEIQSLTRMFHEKIQEKENKPKKKICGSGVFSVSV